MFQDRERRRAAGSTKCQPASFRQRIVVVMLPLTRSLAVRFLNWELCLFPSLPAAGHIPEAVKPSLFQNTCSNARAITASTINRCWLGAVQFAHALAQFRQKNMARAGDMPIFPFVRGANVDDLQ